MSKGKSVPGNNFHCFEGLGKNYWLMEAKGFSRAGVSTGPDGARIEYGLDTDGYAMQNGGMNTPQETRMPPGVYYRFFGTISHNQYGAAGCMAGGWWCDADNYFKIRDWAVQQDISLARAAQALIVIPGAWHDCGYVGRAYLNRELKAYVGKGKPATGSTSPHNAQRDAGKDPIQIAPPHLEMKQWFVPGIRDHLKEYFEVQQVVQVIRKGVYL